MFSAVETVEDFDSVPDETGPERWNTERLLAKGTIVDITHEAIWNVSTAKTGTSVRNLIDGKLDTFWQSNSAVPHFITAQFSYKRKIRAIEIYTNHAADDTYTPRVVVIRVGNDVDSLETVADFGLQNPVGWTTFELNPQSYIDKLVSWKTFKTGKTLTFDKYESWPMYNSYTWTVVAGALFCFTLGGGMGANDVANNFGTSVGSRSVSLKQALVIAAIFELIGSVGLGAIVTDSVRKNVYRDKAVEDVIGNNSHTPSEFLLIANLTVLLTVTVWLFLASYLRMSVSTTHSIIGAYMGCGLAISPKVVNWSYLLTVLSSWFIAPSISLVIAAVFFMLIRKFILRSSKPVIIADRFLPCFLLYVCFVIVEFLVFSNPFSLAHTKCKQGSSISAPCHLSKYARTHVWQSFLVGLGGACLLAIILYFPMKLWIKKRLVEAQAKRFAETAADSLSLRHKSLDSIELAAELDQMQPVAITRADSEPLAFYIHDSDDESIQYSNESLKGTPPSSAEGDQDAVEPGCTGRILRTAPWNRDLHAEAANEEKKVLEFEKLSEKFDVKADAYFKALQVCSAALACLVHGSNDVGNAAAPFASIWTIYQEGTYSATSNVPTWILLLGGSSISIGLMVLGHKVIRTIGIELVHMNAPKGFSVEMALFTVIIAASFLGYTVSSTHVGITAMIGVGLMDRYIDTTTGEDVTPNRWLNVKAVNWKLAGKLCLSWVGTLILTGTLAFLFSSFAFKSPSLR